MAASEKLADDGQGRLQAAPLGEERPQDHCHDVILIVNLSTVLPTVILRYSNTVVSHTLPRRLNRGERKKQTRRRLLEVAGKLFATKGYSETGLDEIAEEAGLTKGAVYSNFTSKADLALAVLDELALGPALEIFSQVDPGESFDDQHLHGGKLLVETMDASSLWFQVELQCALQAGRDDDLRSKLRDRDGALRSTLSASTASRMEKAGWAPTVDIGVIVAALVAVASGVALQRLKDPDSVPVEMAGQLITAVYRQFAEPTGATPQETDRSTSGRKLPCK